MAEASLAAAVQIEPVATLSGHRERVWCVAWCPVANVLASSSGDATVRLWGCASGSDGEPRWVCLATLEGEHTRTVRHVSWSPSGAYLALASFDHTATVWQRSAQDGWEMAVEGVLDGHESEVKCVAWATDCTLATCSRDRTVWVWDRVEEGDYECGGVLTGHTQDVKHCLWWLEEGSRPVLLSCSYDDTVRVWSDAHRRDDWQCVQTLKTHESTVWCAAAQPGAGEGGRRLLCTCSSDLRVVLWQRGTAGLFESLCSCSGFTDRPLYAVAWAPGAPVIACASGDDSVALLTVWQDAEGTHATVAAQVAAAHESDVNSVAFSQTGALLSDNGAVLLASGGDDRAVKLWAVRLVSVA